MSCPCCDGEQTIKSVHYILDSIEKEIMRISEHTYYKKVTLELNKEVYKEINQKWKNILDTIRQKYDIIIEPTCSNCISYEKINIIYNT